MQTTLASPSRSTRRSVYYATGDVTTGNTTGQVVAAYNLNWTFIVGAPVGSTGATGPVGPVGPTATPNYYGYPATFGYSTTSPTSGAMGIDTNDLTTASFIYLSDSSANISSLLILYISTNIDSQIILSSLSIRLKSGSIRFREASRAPVVTRFSPITFVKFRHQFSNAQEVGVYISVAGPEGITGATGPRKHHGTHGTNGSDRTNRLSQRDRTHGAIQYSNGSGAFTSDDAKLHWDDTAYVLDVVVRFAQVRSELVRPL